MIPMDHSSHVDLHSFHLSIPSIPALRPREFARLPAFPRRPPHRNAAKATPNGAREMDGEMRKRAQGGDPESMAVTPQRGFHLFGGFLMLVRFTIPRQCPKAILII